MSQSRLPINIVLPVDLPEQTRYTLTELFRQISTQVNMIAYDTTAVSATTAVASEMVLVDATNNNVRVNLPFAKDWRDREMHIKRKDGSANQVSVVPQSGETIDETATQVISVQYTTLQILSDGKEWWIV